MRTETKKKIQKWILITVTLLLALGMMLPYLWRSR